jgi:hypothetical protein
MWERHGGWRILNSPERLRVAFDKSEGHPWAFFGIKARPPAELLSNQKRLPLAEVAGYAERS